MPIQQNLVATPRPQDVPENWIVCEAPRPLWGHKECDSIWHRVAIDPRRPDAKEMLDSNADSKAVVLRYVCDDDLAPLVRKERAEFAQMFEQWGTTDQEILDDIKGRLFDFSTERDTQSLLDEVCAQLQTA